ncbi:hypothetical protein C1J03_07285 [Sulfitobacter sp. SK012]|uniref:hypothetical protein n=1 Tax=Sulfitobacter sp. SK012 TaxID=1389005 RepID=UPI000E0B9A59|nr:hypothetical protein [Sulfitobacter sp. SK012]AXI45853.1 hypothetical protein C1J03_07285 [Sulfitobacter sp. SK012]
MKAFNRIAVLVGLIAGGIAIYQFSQQQPWFWYVIPGVLTLSLFLPLATPLLSVWQLRKSLYDMEKFISENAIRPKLIITFDRSSAIVGGMLAQRMGISELLALPRSTSETDDELSQRRISVGKNLELLLQPDELEHSLVFIFQLRTGSTFEAGMKSLLAGNNKFPGASVAMYVTEGAKARFPKLLTLKTIKEGESPNAEFPWISGKYIHK